MMGLLQTSCNYSSVLGSRVDGDLGARAQAAGHQIAKALMENFFHFFFDVLEFDVLARLAIGGQDQVVAELSLNHVAHLVGLECEGGLSEGVDHGAGAGEVAEVPTLS